MRRRISVLIILSFARMRSARVFRLIWNLPARVFPQMKVKARKLKVSGVTMRKCMLGALFAAAAVAASAAHAQAPLKLFDAHLHSNSEPTPFYSLDKVLEIFKRNNVAGILANSRPNRGTHALVDAKAPGLWVVPFIRPYRVRSDMQSWFNDPTIYELVQSEYKHGYYVGIGEFHVY